MHAHRDLCQRAVYMAATGKDRFGHTTRAAPVQVNVRFEFSKRRGVGPDGVTEATDAWAAVDRDMPSGSLLWLGELTDWYGTGSGTYVEADVYEVTTKKEIPDEKGRSVRRTVNLRRFSDRVPELTG